MVESKNMKNCMKNFWGDIKKATYGKDYKGDFASKTFGQGVWFFAKLTFVEVVLLVTFLLVFIIPAVRFALDRQNINSFVDSYVPADLQIDIKEGKVTTPNNEVITVLLPDKAKEAEENKNIDNVLVVDPTITENEIEKFEEYKTAVLITSDKIVSVDEGIVKVASMSEVPDYSVNRDSIIALYEKARPFLYTMVPLLVLIGTVLMYIFIMAFSLVANFVLAVVTMIISKIKDVGLSYKESYVVTLYAMAPVTIASWVFFVFKPLNFIWLTILLIVFVVINLNKKTDVTQLEAA